MRNCHVPSLADLMKERRLQLLFATVAVLEIFYPSILAGLCFVDDVQMFKSLYLMHDWSLKGLFSPTGIYYRPLLILSFILDKELWHLNESVMHVENVFLHLINVVLVYYLALSLLTKQEKYNAFLPLICALCFGLHPINTESVNWISGRSDVLAGTFIFLSALSLIKFKQDSNIIYLIVSLLSLFLGMLTKEVALAFIPGMLLLLLANKNDKETERNKKSYRLLLSLAALFLVVPPLGYFIFRSHAFSTDTRHIGKTLITIANDPGNVLFVFVRAFGFYMKKLYLPLPLDFMIWDVDPLYELLALPILLLCIHLLFERTLITALYIAGVILIIPSFPVAFGHIAWTPYAERYVYVTSAFVIIPSVFYLHKRIASLRYKAIAIAGVSIYLTIMTLSTLQRNIYWKQTTSLYKDVKRLVEK